MFNPCSSFSLAVVSVANFALTRVKCATATEGFCSSALSLVEVETSNTVGWIAALHPSGTRWQNFSFPPVAAHHGEGKVIRLRLGASDTRSAEFYSPTSVMVFFFVLYLLFMS